MIEAGLLFAGIIISTAAMAIGIGGGILWAPLLMLGYQLTPQDAIATSLLIQVIGMGSGTVAFYRAGLVETRLSLIIFVIALPGVIIGSLITVNLPPDSVQLALGIMSMSVAILFVSSNDSAENGGNYRFNKKAVIKILPIPATFSFALGSLSLGIGEWLIPALRSKLKLGMRSSIATVIPVMFMLVIIASLIQWNFTQNINLDYFVWGAAGTLIGGQLGPRLAKRINERILKQSFIYIMTLIGIHLIFQAL